MVKYLCFLTLVVAGTSHAADGQFAFKDPRTGLFGFRNAKKRVTIPPQFTRIYVPHPEVDQELFTGKAQEYEFLVPVEKDGKLYRVYRDGTLRFEVVFYDNGPDYYREGLTRFLKNGKVGFHDRQGNIVIRPAYDWASYFSDGRASVCNGCYLEYIEKATFAPLTSSLYCQGVRGEVHSRVVGGKWGRIDAKGSVVVPIAKDSLEEVEKEKD